MKNAMSKIDNMTYGVELEYEGISKHDAIKALEQLFGTRATYAGTYLDAWKVPMADGRMWTVENDGSLSNASIRSITNGVGGTVASFQSNLRMSARSSGLTAHTLCEANLYGFRFLKYLLGNFI